jgi:acetyltransferase-like isoleucine patch superfamily enzyme
LKGKALNAKPQPKTLDKLRYYLDGQSTGLGSYILEQVLFAGLGWVPSVVGIGLRGLLYKLILKAEGMPAIESNVRLVQPGNITLEAGVYLDQQVYLHACPNGIDIGAESFIMHGTIMHVFNFRGLPHAGIKIGKKCFIGEKNVIRGQGGVTIGNYVYTGPLVQILAVNHVFSNPDRPIMDQGITAEGITIEDDVWLSAGVTVLDGVTIGEGSVIGAGSVVTKSLPPYSIAVGAPARRVRDRRDLSENGRATQERYFGQLEELRQ